MRTSQTPRSVCVLKGSRQQTMSGEQLPIAWSGKRPSGVGWGSAHSWCSRCGCPVPQTKPNRSTSVWTIYSSYEKMENPRCLWTSFSLQKVGAWRCSADFFLGLSTCRYFWAHRVLKGPQDALMSQMVHYHTYISLYYKTRFF